jgi:hypothetical protein
VSHLRQRGLQWDLNDVRIKRVRELTSVGFDMVWAFDDIGHPTSDILSQGKRRFCVEESILISSIQQSVYPITDGVPSPSEVVRERIPGLRETRPAVTIQRSSPEPRKSEARELVITLKKALELAEKFIQGVQAFSRINVHKVDQTLNAVVVKKTKILIEEKKSHLIIKLGDDKRLPEPSAPPAPPAPAALETDCSTVTGTGGRYAPLASHETRIESSRRTKRRYC